MKLLSMALILFATAATAEVCSSQRTQFLITGQDLASTEFRANVSNPTATFTLYNYSPTTLNSHNMINPWIGHSWGVDGRGQRWQQIRFQTYQFQNLIPGWRYHLNLKFYLKSVPVMNFSAIQDGLTISQHTLDNSTMGRYWTISFRAAQPTATIQIQHPYASDGTVQKYAQLDYLLITEQPCVEHAPNTPLRGWTTLR